MRLLVVLIVILSFNSCTFFEKEETLLEEHSKANGEKIRIYYVGLGATTRDVIQVRKNNEDQPLWVSDKYNCLNSSKLLNDSSLQIVLNDTGYLHINKPDTLIIDIK